MIWWIIAAILALFLIFAFARKMIHKLLGLKLCAICAAVSLTWLTLLIIKVLGWENSFGFEIDVLVLGILMGESITGIMYLVERLAKERNRSVLLIKPLIIVVGTAFVYLLLRDMVAGAFSKAFLIALTLTVFLITLIVFGLHKRTEKREMDSKRNSRSLTAKRGREKDENRRVDGRYGAFQKEIKKLEENLEHCCD